MLNSPRTLVCAGLSRTAKLDHECVCVLQSLHHAPNIACCPVASHNVEVMLR